MLNESAVDTSPKTKPELICARKWTMLSVHPSVRKLVATDDAHFTGYEGVQLKLPHPREYYGVIGTFELPLRVVSPGDWVIDRSDGSTISLCDEGVLRLYPDLLLADINTLAISKRK